MENFRIIHSYGDPNTADSLKLLVLGLSLCVEGDGQPSAIHNVGAPSW